MTTLAEWRNLAYRAAREEKELTAGSRKILTNFNFSLSNLDDSLTLAHLGYEEKRGVKLKQLQHYYMNTESIARAQSDWADRTKSGTFGSVGITTHGNMKKGYTKQGFCIQAFTLTLLPKTRKLPARTEVHIFYRTTEIVKKFGADLIFFRDVIFPLFDFTKAPISKINFTVAAASVHPMFYLLLALTDPFWKKKILRMKNQDISFYKSVIRWSYNNSHNYYTKFNQSERIFKAMEDHLPPKQLKRIQRFTAREEIKCRATPRTSQSSKTSTMLSIS